MREITEGTEMLGKASEDFAELGMDAAVRKALAGRQIQELDSSFRSCPSLYFCLMPNDVLMVP